MNKRKSILARAVTKGKSQEARILKFFINHPNISFTPVEVWENLNGVGPITSVRRAITNLTNAGYLAKSAVTVLEQFGGPNHFWRLA